MNIVQSIAARVTAMGPIPFFVIGALLFAAGVALQMTQVLSFPDLGIAGTPFGLFAKMGGVVVFIGLLILALRSTGSGEPDAHIPAEVPDSANL